jgi:hypothetical protein
MTTNRMLYLADIATAVKDDIINNTKFEITRWTLSNHFRMDYSLFSDDIIKNYILSIFKSAEDINEACMRRAIYMRKLKN